MVNDNSIEGWGKHILAELKRHDKWLNSIDSKMDNHITHIEHRITKIEAHQDSMKKLFYLTITALLALVGMVFVQLVM